MHLKGSVYAIQEPNSSAYVSLRGQKPQLVDKLHLATLAPADRPECLAELIALASAKLQGTPHELVRVDA